MSIHLLIIFFFFKQKTAYEMRISDWSSDVCSSDLILAKRRLTRAVDVEFLARAIGIRVRDEPQHRGGNIGGIGDAAEGEFGVEMVDIVLSGDRARQFFAHVADGQRRRDDVDAEIGRASCRERVCQYG